MDQLANRRTVFVGVATSREEGTYSCSFSNGAGEGPRSNEESVTVEGEGLFLLLFQVETEHLGYFLDL